MLRATFNNTPQMGVRTLGGTSVGQFEWGTRSQMNVGLYHARGMGDENTSLPNGFNSEIALQMPLVDGGRIEALLQGEGFITAALKGLGQMSATLTGVGTVTPGANMAANGYATLTGVGTLTPGLRAIGHMEATLDAGARPSAFDIAQEVFGTATDGNITIAQAFKLLLSVLVGKVSGAGTPTITFRDIGDTKDRVTASVDASGNRSSVTTNVS